MLQCTNHNIMRISNVSNGLTHYSRKVRCDPISANSTTNTSLKGPKYQAYLKYFKRFPNHSTRQISNVSNGFKITRAHHTGRHNFARRRHPRLFSSKFEIASWRCCLSVQLRRPVNTSHKESKPHADSPQSWVLIRWSASVQRPKVGQAHPKRSRMQGCFPSDTQPYFCLRREAPNLALPCLLA